MRRSPKNVRIAFNHAGLTHFGGIHLLHEFTRVLHFRDFRAQQIRYPRRNRHYSVPQMLMALVYPIVLGLDRIETASLLRANGTFQYLTGLPSFPDPQTLRRFLLNAPVHLREQLHRANDRLLQKFRMQMRIFRLNSYGSTEFHAGFKCERCIKAEYTDLWSRSSILALHFVQRPVVAAF